MGLNQIQNEVAEWTNRNFPNNTYVEPLLGVGEEYGELLHAILKTRQGIRGTEAEHREAELDSVGDLLIYLLDYAARRNFDLEGVLALTWAKVKQRDWTKNKTNGQVTDGNQP